MKHYLLVSVFFLFWSCSSPEDDPATVVGPPSFQDPSAVLDVHPNSSYSVNILNFEQRKYRLKLNGSTLAIFVQKIDETLSSVSFVIPHKIGSGKIELHEYEGTTIITGPQVNYVQRYLPLTISITVTGGAMCGYIDNKVIIWDPLTVDLKVLRFKDFNSSTNQYSFGVKNYPITYDGDGVTRRYEFTGITRSPEGAVTFYRTFVGDPSSDRDYRILTTSDLATATDFSGGIATDHVSTVFDLEQDSEGNLYTVEASRLYIQKIYPDGLYQFAGSGISGIADGTNIDASFRRIGGITIDGEDNLYVADSSRVRMINPDGVVTTIAGSVETGNVDGSLSDARFGGLMGISIAPNGELYLYDGRNGKFKMINADRTTVRTLKMIDGRTFVPGKYDADAPMYVDANGNIFFMRNEGLLYMLMPEDNAPEGVAQSFSQGSWSSNAVAE